MGVFDGPEKVLRTGSDWKKFYKCLDCDLQWRAEFAPSNCWSCEKPGHLMTTEEALKEAFTL